MISVQTAKRLTAVGSRHIVNEIRFRVWRANEDSLQKIPPKLGSQRLQVLRRRAARLSLRRTRKDDITHLTPRIQAEGEIAEPSFEERRQMQASSRRHLFSSDTIVACAIAACVTMITSPSFALSSSIAISTDSTAAPCCLSRIVCTRQKKENCDKGRHDCEVFTGERPELCDKDYILCLQACENSN